MNRPSKRDVFELHYMRLIRAALNTLGQWPNRVFGSRSRRAAMLHAYNYFVLVVAVCQEFSAIGYLIKNYTKIPFIDVGQIFANLILTGLFFQRSALPLQKKFCNVVKKFVLEFHLAHHEHISEYAVKQHTWVNKICSLVSKYLLLQVFMGLSFYNLFPLLSNVQAGMFSENRPENKTFLLSVDFLLPFDYKKELTGYVIVFIYNWYPSYNIPAAICFYDLLLFIMVFHISGHLSILTNSLENFPQPIGNYDNGERTTQEYNDQAFILLKGLVKHYQLIYHFMKDVSEAFSITLYCYLIFHQLMCCLLLLECSTLDRDALGKFGMLTLFVFQQLIQTSLIFEVIDTKSDDLGDQVYGLPWEHMDVKNRRVVLLLLHNVQPPLGLKAGGMVTIGVLTMSTIMRTSFSYFLFLKTLG